MVTPSRIFHVLCFYFGLDSGKYFAPGFVLQPVYHDHAVFFRLCIPTSNALKYPWLLIFIYFSKFHTNVFLLIYTDSSFLPQTELKCRQLLKIMCSIPLYGHICPNYAINPRSSRLYSKQVVFRCSSQAGWNKWGEMNHRWIISDAAFQYTYSDGRPPPILPTLMGILAMLLQWWSRLFS